MSGSLWPQEKPGNLDNPSAQPFTPVFRQKLPSLFCVWQETPCVTGGETHTLTHTRTCTVGKVIEGLTDSDPFLLRINFCRSAYTTYQERCFDLEESMRAEKLRNYKEKCILSQSVTHSFVHPSLGTEISSSYVFTSIDWICGKKKCHRLTFSGTNF